MSDFCQHTLASSIRMCGVGVHSGELTELVFKPAPIDTGIVFVRTDCQPNVEIPAQVAFVSDCSWSTTLSHKGVSVSTVEHLLAACAGLGVDNLFIELDKQEVPIMDGSASPFVFALQAAGIQPQPEGVR